MTVTMTVTMTYIPFENMLTKKCPGIYILLQFSWGHNQIPDVQVTDNY